MQTDEVLVFKTFDSKRTAADDPSNATDTASPFARFAPHCAVEDPTAAADAPTRRSLEVRCFCVFS